MKPTASRIAVAALFFATLPLNPAAGDQAKEQQLIKTLQSAEPADKAIACKQLAIYGSKDAVPELAKLLADEQLASWARIALEAIPDPAAGKALLDATGALKGQLLVGVINSIGVRRDADADASLAGHLKAQDAEVASAAAVALGRIANPAATKALQQSLNESPVGVRSAVAEGLILCAERLMAEGNTTEAAAIYDEVRQADVPKPRVLEATRGAILASKSNGISLLVDQLRSSDKGLFQIGLSTARELPGQEVGAALASELGRLKPDRAALVLVALADRPDASLSPAVLEAAKRGDKRVRAAAIGVVGRFADPAAIATLLEIATEADAELAQAAKAALAGLPGEKVDAELAARLPDADGKSLAVLIELVGERRMSATPALVNALDHADQAIRTAALAALGETIAQNDLHVLISRVIDPKHVSDAEAAQAALRAACVRMPDREACAAELAAALPRVSEANKLAILETLGAVGGAKALATIAEVVKSDPHLQDAGTRILGEWMTADAAPVLLDLAKDPAVKKYQVRALRGYLRIARQFALPDAQRVEMARNALAAATRPEEKKLVLEVLERYPQAEGLDIAAKAMQTPELKQDAGRAALVIAQKLAGNSDDLEKLLAKIGLDPVKVEIIKAEYGAGATQKDVTDVLQQQVRDVPLITLSSPSYNKSFGGDPAPLSPKQLKIEYKIDGKVATASFDENAVIMLPMPE